MNGTELMELPKCKVHNLYMNLRDRTTEEQDFCGTWYDCPRCANSVCIPSAELLTFLKGESTC